MPLRPAPRLCALSPPATPITNLAFRRFSVFSLIQRPPDLARQTLCDQIPRARAAEDHASRQRQEHDLVGLTFYPRRQTRLSRCATQLRFRCFRRQRFRRLTNHTRATARSSVIPPVSKAAVAVSTALLKYWKIAHKQSAPPTAAKNAARVIIASPPSQTDGGISQRPPFRLKKIGNGDDEIGQPIQRRPPESINLAMMTPATNAVSTLENGWCSMDSVIRAVRVCRSCRAG